MLDAYSRLAGSSQASHACAGVGMRHAKLGKRKSQLAMILSLHAEQCTALESGFDLCIHSSVLPRSLKACWQRPAKTEYVSQLGLSSGFVVSKSS